MTAIKEPRIYAALTAHDGRTDLLVRRSDYSSADKTLGWVRCNLREGEREGHHALSQRIGTVVLNMLIEAHPDEFARYPLLVPPDLSTLDRLRGLVLDLIHRTTAERTTAYVAALDAIFAHNATELAQTSLPEQWQSIRIHVTTLFEPTH